MELTFVKGRMQYRTRFRELYIQSRMRYTGK